MGELGAFLKITRVPAPERDPRARVRGLQGDLRGPARGRGRAPGRALHGVRRAVLPRRLPARQPDPGLERPRLQGPLARGDRPAARDQRLPRVHRPDLPGAVRARLRARDQRRPGLDQADRAGDRRARVGGGLDRAAPARARAAGAASAVVGSARPGWPPPRSSTAPGHDVVVYERDEGPGGLLRFGVPDFKLEKWYIDRRVARARGRGRAVRVRRRRRHRRRPPRSSPPATTRSCWRSARACTARSTCRAPTCAGVRFAMDYLYARNRWVARGDAPGDDPELTAAGKHVVVIGGGDTAMDCVGNAHRERAASVTVLDTYPAPPGPAARDSVPWPEAPRRLVSTYALDEGGERRWTQTATRLDGRDGHVVAVHGSYVTPPPGPRAGARHRVRAAGRPRAVAIGFSHPEHARRGRAARARARPPRQREGADVRDARIRACSPPATRASASR